MKTLRDVLPHEFFLSYMDTEAAKYLDVEVVATYGSGDNLELKSWVGVHRNVYIWWQLANGKAVAWNENPGRGWSFPVRPVKD